MDAKEKRKLNPGYLVAWLTDIEFILFLLDRDTPRTWGGWVDEWNDGGCKDVRLLGSTPVGGCERLRIVYIHFTFIIMINQLYILIIIKLACTIIII